VRRVVDEAGNVPRVDRDALQELGERARLVADTLGDVADPELAHARGHRGGAAPRDPGDADAGGDQRLDAVAVAHVEGLEALAVRAIPESAVRQHAVHVEHEKRNLGGRRHITPARSRSCTLSAPTSRPDSSSTSRPLIECFSIMRTASAASSPGEIVRGLKVITSAMMLWWMSTRRSSAR